VTAFALSAEQQSFAAKVRAPRIYEGTSEIQRTIIARDLFRPADQK
jgi:alkylation response protein AidB-like acyl-CoA dehydrogenase